MACTKRKFCNIMEDRLNPEANHGKGLTIFFVTNIRTNRGKKVGVMYKRSEADRGVLITYCPWCGTNLLELFNVAVKQE